MANPLKNFMASFMAADFCIVASQVLSADVVPKKFPVQVSILSKVTWESLADVCEDVCIHV